jgi:hypothetical protein
MPTGNIVTFETMLIGYTDAAARFDDAAKEHDVQLAFTAAFEALNWPQGWAGQPVPSGAGWAQGRGRCALSVI